MSTPQPLKLPQRLSNDFDRTVIKRFREWEKMERKLAAFRNHLHFTLHCKHHGVFPRSLTLNCSMKGAGVEKILQRTQRALTNERITRIKQQIRFYQDKKDDCDEYLFTHLTNGVYTEVYNWMKQLRTKVFDIIRERQKTKFARLQAKQLGLGGDNDPIVNVDPTERENITSKWVVNLSDHVLSTAETSLLRKGLNYAISPANIPTHEYIIGIEQACRNLGSETKEAERLRSDCVRTLRLASPPKPNISKQEKSALKDLSKNEEIMILPADKGRSVVVLNSKDYKDKARALLSDTATYKKLDKDPTTKYTAALVNELKEIHNAGALTDIQYRTLYPTSSTIPRFYGLPKVHKTGAPLRPIIASTGSLTYQVARHVADILAPLVGNNGYALKNSAEMVKDLGESQLGDTDVLVSFDVTALFTRVPVDKSLEIISDRLHTDPDLSSRTMMTALQVKSLLSFCLKTTYFLYEGDIYSQVEGAAMGSPVSPIVANLFMEWFEAHAIQTFKFQLTFWRRYVDDTIVALCDSLVDDLSEHINAVDPAIQFTREEESNGSLPMLDALTTRDSAGNLTFSVYRKPTHTDQYLQFDSNQPLHHKLGVIRTLHHRCMTLCSEEQSKLQELDHLKKVLSVSGYTKSAWVTATRPRPPTVPTDPSQSRKRGHITLPYVGHVSNAIARCVRKTGIAVHMKPYNTIRRHLVHPKDKVPTLEQSGVVYQMQCADCPASYVGETERNLRKRVNEHHRSSSPVGHHLDFNTHKLADPEVSILHREPDWFKRGVAEAIHVEEQSPTLNRGRERHTLPAIYRELLTSSSRDPPNPAGGHVTNR